jgi:hypothetical protein
MNEQNNWAFFDMFFSSQRTQTYLAAQYEQIRVKDFTTKSFENCYGFIYYIEHGKKYYHLSQQAPQEIKPVLLFYGMIQLLKACILTVDPDYPDSSSVLAHGLSTRKRKKRSYEFLLDEVKVQKTGLFNHFCEKLFHMKHIEGEKFRMDHLLKLLPELSPLHEQMNGTAYQTRMDRFTNKTFILSDTAPDYLHMTKSRFMEYINTTFASKIRIEIQTETPEKFLVHLNDLNQKFDCFPLSFHLNEQTFYFPIDRELLQAPFLNEIMVHYVLLYNLSMLSRYDTEWWSEIFHTYTSEELPFISQFLTITANKIPFLLGQFLLSKNLL